jgi:hypothetical protein
MSCININNSFKELNENLIEIVKDYLEIFTLFNSKLQAIQADEILSADFMSIQATILDLSINLSNFKSNITTCTDDINNLSSNDNKNINSNENKELTALFFLYTMLIDKKSILNSSTFNTIDNTIDNTKIQFQSQPVLQNKLNSSYDYEDPDLD